MHSKQPTNLQYDNGRERQKQAKQAKQEARAKYVLECARPQSGHMHNERYIVEQTHVQETQPFSLFASSIHIVYAAASKHLVRNDAFTFGAPRFTASSMQFNSDLQ